MMPLLLTINGETADPADLASPLVRAVLVSLFTWRRALPDDDLPGADRMGWWGDTWPTVRGDRIGSRLWLLSRSKLMNATPGLAVEYAREALQWLIDDGVAEAVNVEAERQGLDRLALGVVINRGAGDRVDIRFADVWATVSQ
jgi:phage gp46-like protein